MSEQGNLFGPSEPLPRQSIAYPAWFTPGKTTPAAHKRAVAQGLHPLGVGLTEVPGALCGNCEWWMWAGGTATAYAKCRLMYRENHTTHGPGTDIRAKWRGCGLWRVAPPEARVPRRRP